MIAVSLLAPLTIHAFVATILGASAAHFDEWIAISLVVVGHAHLAHAWRCYAFATGARVLDADELMLARPRAEWRAFGIAVVVSALPGALLYLIPPILTAGTGILFNPILFRGMTRTIVAERRALA
jgi:hypothetical protein